VRRHHIRPMRSFANSGTNGAHSFAAETSQPR
jgi:hypothetical protein